MNNIEPKIEFVSCCKLIKDGLICPHDLFWTLYYIIKYSILDVAFFYDKNDQSKKDIVIHNHWTRDNPSWDGVYIKAIDGEPFRMGWKNKPNYNVCYCSSCVLAKEYGFESKWEKSNRFLDKINWFFRKSIK